MSPSWIGFASSWITCTWTGPVRVLDSYTLRTSASAFAANLGLEHAAVITCIGAAGGCADEHAQHASAASVARDILLEPARIRRS